MFSALDIQDGGVKLFLIDQQSLLIFQVSSSLSNLISKFLKLDC